jgi:hypothetical protein
MKNAVFIFLLLANGLQLFAQNQLLIDATELNDNANQVNGYKKLTYIEGTPYLNENNTVGTFYKKDKTTVKTPTKLNMYYNSFEYIVDNKTYLVNPITIDSVSVNNETYVFIDFSINGDNSTKVVRIIDNKGINKLCVYKGVYITPEVQPAGYVDSKPARFEWLDPVYLFEIKGKIIVLKNFRSVTGLFPKAENDIKKYIKENHIRINNQNNLKNLLSYISQLK